MLKKIIAYFTSDIWNLKLRNQHGLRYVRISAARVTMLSARLCSETNCQQNAAALTYLSLLSIVPIAALAFAIAKGFGLEALLEQRLLQSMQGQQEAVERIIGFARALIENTRGGLVAGAGIALLLWTVIKMLGNIEEAFNSIWGVRAARSLGKKCTDYLSVMLLCPVLLIISGSITVTIASEARLVIERFPIFSGVGKLILASLGLVPYVFMWGLFSFLYLFMPNRKIRPAPGFIAGIAAGTAYQIVQWIYIKFQIGIAGYNAIYGGFAALPLFLVWLQTSWTIALLGAAVSRACQTVHCYDFDPGRGRASHSLRRFLAVRAAQAVVKIFEGGHDPPSAEHLAARLESPPLLLQQVLDELVSCGILTAVKRPGAEAAYQPARSPNRLTIAAVLDALDDCGEFPVHMARDQEADELCRRLAAFKSRVERSPENAFLKDI